MYSCQNTPFHHSGVELWAYGAVLLSRPLSLMILGKDNSQSDAGSASSMRSSVHAPSAHNTTQARGCILSLDPDPAP